MPHERVGNFMELERTGQRSYVPAVATSYVAQPPADGSGDSVGLDDLTTALWRRKWTIAGTTILGLLSGLAVSLLVAPTYRARVLADRGV